MKKVAMMMLIVIFSIGTLTWSSSAQTENRGAAIIHSLAKANPIVKPAACYFMGGGTGYCGCGPGWTSACGLRCCRCVRCR